MVVHGNIRILIKLSKNIAFLRALFLLLFPSCGFDIFLLTFLRNLPIALWKRWRLVQLSIQLLIHLLQAPFFVFEYFDVGVVYGDFEGHINLLLSDFSLNGLDLQLSFPNLTPLHLNVLLLAFVVGTGEL